MNEDEQNNAAHSQPNNDDANNDPVKKDPSDNLTPEHPRFKQVIEKTHEQAAEIEELRTQLEEMKQSISDRQTQTNEDELTAEEEASLNRIERKLKERKAFVSPDELRVQQRAGIYTKLEEKYNGSDDLPKFNKTDVVAYAKENGFNADTESGLAAAYRDMHFDAIVQKASKGQNGITPPDSEQPTGQERKIPNTDMTPEQIAMMNDSDYEKNRENILAALKPKRVITP